MQAKYSAAQIANWFLKYNECIALESQEETDPITNLKLQKLLYYAQGTYLALKDGQPLFGEPLLAWKHGPVVECIYNKYRQYCSQPLASDDDFAINDVDEDTQNILKAVYEQFGQFSAWKLRNMTHEEAPWKQTLPGGEISNKSIREYFDAHYVE